MKTNDFLETLSRIGNDPEFEKDIKKSKKARVTKISTACVGVAALVMGAVFLFKIVPSKQPKVTPFDSTPTALPEANPGVLDIFGTVSYAPANKSDWFVGKTISVKPLSYSAMNKSVYTLNTTNFGTNLISTEVFGEHENCPGVCYNTENDRVVCLYHEFLNASQLSLGDDYHAAFISDPMNNGLFVVRIYEADSFLTEELWVFDRNTGYAAELPLPDGCSAYNEIYIYNKSLYDGKLCVGVNNTDGKHFVYVYNTETKEGIRLPGDYRMWVSAEFLSERILLISNDGYSFYNVDTDKTVNVIGEYNYYADGKVFSVKNWGWASHNDVEVAVYDASTGKTLDNENVLVQTVLDNGEKIFLTKNTTTGEETILLEDFSGNCYTWTNDGQYFYAFSAVNQKLLCYSASDGDWFLSSVPDIDTEPMKIDVNKEAVFTNYALTVNDSGNNVLLYYTRSIVEIPNIPDYDEEEVDSPFWNAYREMKALNFADETYFGFAVKENINIRGEGASIYLGNPDMEKFRDIILACFENGTLIPGKMISEENIQNKDLALDCRFLMMDFFRENGKRYISMAYSKQQPVGFINEVYEIPESLFDEINGYCYNYMRSEEPILTPSPKPFEKEDEYDLLPFDEKAETPDSPVSTELDDCDGQIVKIGRSNVFPPVLLTNGNTNVVPHFVMYSGEIFSEFFNGMMSVRGDPINYDEMLLLLPEINGEEDWYINANGDNIVRSVTFYTIDDNSSEKIAYINDVIAPFGKKTPVKDLINQCKDSGSYLVEIKAQVKGEFISETDKNESFVFSCLFKVIVT